MEYPPAEDISLTQCAEPPPMMTRVPKSARGTDQRERSRATRIPSRIRGSTMSPNGRGWLPGPLAAWDAVSIPAWSGVPRNRRAFGVQGRLLHQDDTPAVIGVPAQPPAAGRQSTPGVPWAGL